VEAFRKAIDLGAAAVELDVHQTRDDHLVVHHDDDLTRCTDIRTRGCAGNQSEPFFVSDFTLEQIQRLDAGGWFVRAWRDALRGASSESYLNQLTDAERQAYITDADLVHYGSGQVRIPTLDDVLDLIQESHLLVNIELKTLPRRYPGLTEQVVRVIQKRELTGQTVLSSFDHPTLLTARTLDRRIPTAVLTSDRLARPADYLSLLDASAYNPGCYNGYDSLGFDSISGKLDTRAIDDCRQSGFGVNVWTCNDPVQMKQLMEAGVTGLISDIPNRVSHVIAQG
jgi:glycerophosphoryl diester phosphodiesterase